MTSSFWPTSPSRPETPKEEMESDSAVRLLISKFWSNLLSLEGDAWGKRSQRPWSKIWSFVELAAEESADEMNSNWLMRAPVQPAVDFSGSLTTTEQLFPAIFFSPISELSDSKFGANFKSRVCKIFGFLAGFSFSSFSQTSVWLKYEFQSDVEKLHDLHLKSSSWDQYQQTLCLSKLAPRF